MMDTKAINDGGPAFPMPSGAEPRVNETTHYNEGMTLRDYFAAHAPALPHDLAELAREEADVDNPNKTHGEKSGVLLGIRAHWNYMYADAMIEARNGGES